MGFEIFWYYQPRIVQIVAHGEFTVENVEKIHRQVVSQYFTGAREPIHLILDVRAMTKFPVREARIAMLFEQMLRHGSCGRLLVIRADNPVQFFLMSSITQVIGSHFQQARSLPDAVAVLQGYDTSLYKIAI